MSESSRAIKKAMVDRDIKGARKLHEISGLSYNKVIRILKGDDSCRQCDIDFIASVVGIRFVATSL